MQFYKPPKDLTKHGPLKQFVENAFTIEELQRHAPILVSRAARGEDIEIFRNGESIARIIPTRSDEERLARVKKIWAEMDELAEEISKKWDDPSMTAVDAVREQRRDL